MANFQEIQEVQAFFGPRAQGWEQKFPDDDVLFERAVQELVIPKGATVLDLGCGTGRALLPLHQAVGNKGRVVGLDATLLMLNEAQRHGRQVLAGLLQADVSNLPLPNACVNAVFASGLLPHLVNPQAGLVEMARVTVSGGLLAIFHPISRKALAARHNRVLSDDDVLARPRLTSLLKSAAWELLNFDDSDERFFAVARHMPLEVRS